MLNFQDLYESYATEIYRFAFWLSGNRFDAEDITSEVFIRAWTHSSTIRTETLKAYLFTIARNIYLQQRRKANRQVELDPVHVDPTPEPDEVVETQLQLGKVRQILQSLPEVDRTAIVLRAQHELPYEEIARILGLSLTAAKVKVHRARKKLFMACNNEEVW
jgi:RNA polymerase sigma-70 factor (ECF subfamily)